MATLSVFFRWLIPLYAGVGAFAAQAQGIEFFKGTFDEGLRQAAQQSKLVFVDAYASWCGPCKSMAANIFPLKEVGDYYNEHFVCMKIDMEKDADGPALSKKYKVGAYPTFLYLDAEGKLLHTAVGGRPADGFLNEAKNALKKIDQGGSLEEKYQQGDRSPELLRKYAHALMQKGNPNPKVVNEYIATQRDWTTEQNLKFLFDMTLEADSKVFELLLGQYAALVTLKGEAAVLRKIEAACMRTVQKAAEYEAPELLSTAKNKALALGKDAAREFELKADVAYALHARKPADYLRAADKHLQASGKNQAELYMQYAENVLQYFPDSPEAIRRALKWLDKMPTNAQQTYPTLLLEGQLLIADKRFDKASERLQQAVEVARARNLPASEAERLLQEIRRSPK